MRLCIDPRQAQSPTGLRTAVFGGLLALLVLAVGTESADAKTYWSSFRPARSAGRTCIHIGGKDSRYYKLDTKRAIEFTAHGPNRIRLITRHLPLRGRTDERTYTLRVVRDGREILTKTITAGRSKSATLCSDVGQAAGSGKKSYVTVPKGKHTFRVYIQEDDNPVALKIYKQKKSKKTTLVSFSPDNYDRVCTLVVSSGKEYPHYHFTRETPLRFQVHGPTSLEVWTRADFDHTMMGGASYGLEVLRNGISHTTAHYDNVRKLGTASYREEECREILPGERKNLTLKVPRGTWTYEIRPAEVGPEAIAARILIPKKDIPNGEGQ